MAWHSGCSCPAAAAPIQETGTVRRNCSAQDPGGKTNQRDRSRQTEITVVVDNRSDNGIDGEWGLSVFVEYAGKKILLDTGASDLFLTNLEKLGLEAGEMDYLVLSHAHYDHANGIPAFFENNPKAKLYVRKGTAADCYAKKFLVRKYIGIPRNVLTDYSSRIEYVDGDYCLTDGVYLIPHKTRGLSTIGKRELMYRRVEKKWVPDDFSHEQSLVLDTAKGLLILNSCSHGGVVNIINEVRATFPEKHVYGIVGGFHLFNKTEKEIRELSEAIKSTGIDYICTGHCTKDRAYAILRKDLGDKLEQMKVGYKRSF